METKKGFVMVRGQNRIKILDTTNKLQAMVIANQASKAKGTVKLFNCSFTKDATKGFANVVMGGRVLF